jgi:hypothetical protein
MKKKILIITYYYFPLNAVVSYRANSMFKYFHQAGFEVTLVTRHWDSQYRGWQDAVATNNKEVEIVNNEHGTIIYLPYNAIVRIYTNKILNKLAYLMTYLKGNIHPEVNAYEAFYPFLKKHLNTNKFDGILVTAPPNNIVKLGGKLSKEFEIPLFIDFRDFFNDQLFNNNYAFNLNAEILYRLSILYMKKWVKPAKFLISVSPSYAQTIGSIFNKLAFPITNGYEKELFENSIIVPNSKFTIRYIGSCYEMQDFTTVIAGLKKFTETHSDVVIELVALLNDEVIELFKKSINPVFLKVIVNRVSRVEVINMTLNTDVLFFPCLKGYRGIYGTKLFEFIASGSFVLIAPGDNDVVDILLKETGGGSVANSVNEVLNVLEGEYNKWLSGKNKIVVSDSISKYSRENTMLELAAKINKFL